MRHALVDKKVAGIIRWLERLKQSYSSGAMESALMEAECARADLEILRADVWQKISAESYGFQQNKVLERIMKFSKIGFLTLIIVLLTVFPISKDPLQSAKVIEEDKSKLVLAEPIQIIYEEPKLSKTQNQSTVSQTETKTVHKVSAKAKPDVTKTQKNSVQVQPTQPSPPVNQKKVAYEELFSLMQTGQRALKNNSSVVKISK